MIQFLVGSTLDYLYSAFYEIHWIDEKMNINWLR